MNRHAMAAELLRSAAHLIDRAADHADIVLGYSESGYPIRSGYAETVAQLAAETRDLADSLAEVKE